MACMGTSSSEASSEAQAQKRAHADNEHYWDSIVWSDETKINVFGTDDDETWWCKGGGSGPRWVCRSAAAVIYGTMNLQM